MRILTCMALLLVWLAGCATMRPDAVRVRAVWESRDQFVRIETGERAPSIPSNSHPATVAPDTIRNALSQLRVSFPGAEKPLPLLTDSQLKLLEASLAKGLGLAGPDEDVTFAVIGNYPTALGLASEPKVTTGRVFVRAGKLNVVFGIVQRDVRDNEDRRLNPFTPGSRLAALHRSWQIIPTSDRVTFEPQRGDWLIFPLDLPPAAEEVREEKAATPPAPSPGKPRTSVEERLMILNELKNKGLITEEEYREKRRGILQEL